MVAHRVEKRRRELNFKRFRPLHQVDERRPRNGQIRQNLRSRLRQLGLRLHEVCIRLSVFHQRRRGADLSGEQRCSFLGERGASLAGGREFVNESLSRAGVQVPCRPNGSVAQLFTQQPHLGSGA